MGKDILTTIDFTLTDNIVKVSLEGFPTEYRISKNEDMSESQWVYLNINEWIKCTEESEGKIYLQLRNCFGESGVFEIR